MMNYFWHQLAFYMCSQNVKQFVQFVNATVPNKITHKMPSRVAKKAHHPCTPWLIILISGRLFWLSCYRWQTRYRAWHSERWRKREAQPLVGSLLWVSFSALMPLV